MTCQFIKIAVVTSWTVKRGVGLATWGSHQVPAKQWEIRSGSVETCKLVTFHAVGLFAAVWRRTGDQNGDDTQSTLAIMNCCPQQDMPVSNLSQCDVTEVHRISAKNTLQLVPFTTAWRNVAQPQSGNKFSSLSMGQWKAVVSWVSQASRVTKVKLYQSTEYCRPIIWSSP